MHVYGPKGGGRGWHLARVWGILEDGRYEVAFDSGETDNLHPSRVCKEDEYETNMNRLVAMFHSFKKKREEREGSCCCSCSAVTTSHSTAKNK